MMRAAILTISTSKAARAAAAGAPKAAAAIAEDLSGAELARFAEGLGLTVAARELITDDRGLIEARLRELCGQGRCELVLTTGGTGMSPSDVTPEATSAVIDRPAPGIAEAMRAASREHTPNWMLSRGVAGVSGATLIVNFPGSPGEHRPGRRGDRRGAPPRPCAACGGVARALIAVFPRRLARRRGLSSVRRRPRAPRRLDCARRWCSAQVRRHPLRACSGSTRRRSWRPAGLPRRPGRRHGRNRGRARVQARRPRRANGSQESETATA